MPTLANVQGSSLVPNFTGATGTLLQAFGTKQTRDAQARAEAQQLAAQQKADQQQLEIEQAAQDFATGDANQKNAAIARIIARDPKVGKALLDLRDSGTEAQQAAAAAEAERGLRQGVKLKRLKSPQAQRKELGRMADIELAEGRDVTPIMDMMNLPDEELGLAIQDKIDLGTDIGDLVKSVTAPTDINLRKQQLAEDKFAFEQAKVRAETASASADVQSAKILEDGTTILAMKDGSTRVNDPQGNALSGEAREKAIIDAVEFGVDVQGRRAGTRAGQAQRKADNQKLATEAFKAAGPIRSSLNNINRGIELLEKEGADTGPFLKLFPSIKASSIKLDNIMNNLGLDIVSATTFGALSAGELQLALDTALPTGLRPKELANWLRDKRSAQRAVLQQLNNTAIHLSEGGDLSTLIGQNAQADVGAAPAATAPAPANGAVMNFDAQGNLIQ